MAILVIFALLGLPAVALLLTHCGRAREGRWGRRELTPTRSGDAPYRDGLLRDRVPLGAPPSARLSGAFLLLWGPFKGVVLAPAGVFYGSALVSDGHALTGLLVTLVGFSGLCLGWCLMSAGPKILRREDLPWLQQLATWSVVHHGAVIVAFAADAAAEPRGAVFAFALGFALLGLAGTGLFVRALGVAAHRDTLIHLRDQA